MPEAIFHRARLRYRSHRPAASRRRRVPFGGAALRHQGQGRRARPRRSSPRTARRSAAALFTTNLAQAAPVMSRRRHLERTHGHARARSSSTAAAPTPAPATDGLADADAHGRGMAAALGCQSGAGARRLHRRHRRESPMDKVVSRASSGRVGALARGKGSDAARAIMTTDPFPKEARGAVDDRRAGRSRSAASPKAPA